MNSLARSTSAYVAILVLSACHADVTERVTIHGNGLATVTLREVIDDELYDLAQRRGGLYRLRINSLASQGWEPKRAIDENGNHVLTAAKTAKATDVADTLAQLQPVPGLTPIIRPENTANVIGRGLFSDRVDIDMRTTPEAPPTRFGRGLGPWREAILVAMPSLLQVHFELFVPGGEVLSTNGERMPDGALRWDVNPGDPARIEAHYRIVYWQRASLVAMAVFGLALLPTMALMRLRQ